MNLNVFNFVQNCFRLIDICTTLIRYSPIMIPILINIQIPIVIKVVTRIIKYNIIHLDTY